MTKKPSKQEPEDLEAEPLDPHEEETFKEKFSNHFKKEKLDNIYSYMQENTVDTIAYILLVIGIILLFFLTYWGQLIIGIVAGYYFSFEIINWTKSWETRIHELGLVKSIVYVGTLVAFVIKAPLIFAGAAIVSGLKYLFISEKA